MKEVLDYNVKPEHYNLKIQIREDFFEGEEEVYIKVLKKTSKFNFNVEGLELKEVKVFVNGEVKKIDYETVDTFVTVKFKDLEIGATDGVKLYIKFTGYFSEDMSGFYKSKYNEDDLYSTDFEPTSARRAFPCWDQPDMKATFDIAIKPVEGFGALSNSSFKEIKDGFYYFNTTPKMSTYIVAFISGKLEPYIMYTTRNIPISVYSQRDEVNWGKYAAKVAVECLDFYENYFGIDYPLPKLDLVTIPTFVNGAMENWGLIVFRKTSLLYDLKTSSLSSKKLIAETVCHELAHMWFGNLVTMTWWDDLWLNEGFATWASHLAMSNISKKLIDWDVWTKFITDNNETGMNYDWLNSSHPVAMTVNKASEVIQMFDAITYSKGASMIRMLEGYIGATAFRDGIRTYLQKFQYSNTCTDDLWKSFPGELYVQEMMNDWINRQGFPILNVLKNDNNTCDDTELHRLKIEQQRFLLSGTNNKDLWKIPLKIRWFGDDEITEKNLMIDKTLTLNKKGKFYILNDGGSAFFRVKYPLENLTKLLQLNISASNKLNLINDMFALIFSNRMLAKDGITLSLFFIREKNPDILESILSNLSNIRSLFADVKSVVNHINEVIWNIVGPRALHIDFLDNDLKTEEAITNSLLLQYGLSTGDMNLKRKLAGGFGLYKKGRYVNPEYLKTIFAAVADAKFDELCYLAKYSKLPDEKTMALKSLAYLQKEYQLEDMFSRLKKIEPHNSIYFFIELPSNLIHRTFIINYILDNFDELRRYMKNDMLFQNVIEYVLGKVSYMRLVDKTTQLLLTKKNGDIVLAINKTIEKIEQNREFRKYNENLITERD